VKYLSHTKGITALQILMGVIILAIIIALVLPRIIYSQRTAREHSCYSNVKRIDEQIELWHVRKGGWPSLDLADISADSDYFPSGIPVCPVTGAPYFLDNSTYRIVAHLDGDHDPAGGGGGSISRTTTAAAGPRA